MATYRHILVADTVGDRNGNKEKTLEMDRAHSDLRKPTNNVTRQALREKEERTTEEYLTPKFRD